MSETPAGYYTDADAIRAALGKHGPLSRADLVKASDVPRDVLAKALYALKKQGDVIEEGDRVMLAQGSNTAQDAHKEDEVSNRDTPRPECSTEHIKPFCDASIPPVHPGIVALNAAAQHLIDLLAENAALTERIAALESRISTISEALATADRLQVKFAQLRGLLDD